MAVRKRFPTKQMEDTVELAEVMRNLARPLRRTEDLDPLMARIGSARLVLLGEASHGTSEYYTWRAALTRRLIVEKGFSLIAVEGDWPDCYQINRYIKGAKDAPDHARDVLAGFTRWPTWMWANDEIGGLCEWLRSHNNKLPAAEKVGFFGLDVYSLWESLYAIMVYLHQHLPDSLPAAWRALRCFEPYGEEAQEYARATAAFVPKTCEREVINLLAELRRRAPEVPGEDQREAYFQAEQNALVVKNAESYYRAMVHGGPESWNIRDHHMMSTLQRLLVHHGPDSKVIVWEHNTHIGDARYTDMRDDSMINIGQLARERYEHEGVVLVGFGSYQGTVIAGRQWGAPWEVMEVPPAVAGSWEEVLHQTSPEDKLFIFTGPEPDELLLKRRGHRAIGVVYHPEFEHYGNYVPTVLPYRYDAFLYLDRTKALTPMPTRTVEEEEMPETYPSGV